MALQTTLYIKNISSISIPAPDEIQWSFLDIDGHEAMNLDGTLKRGRIVDLYELNGRVVIAKSTELKQLIENDILIVVDENQQVLDKLNSLYRIALPTVIETENIAKKINEQ